MGLIQQIALVSEIDALSLRSLTRVAAALQRQATRDLGPIWEVTADVSAFASLDDVPVGYWPIIVAEHVTNAAGVHLDRNGQPFALVEFGPSWSLTASHECLEMLVDPWGSRVIAGPSPKPDQGRVEFLVEICDPCEGRQFAYTVNDVLVSDFYTPHYFDPRRASGVRYSFQGTLTEPRQVLDGGYLSWHEPISDHWFQETFFEGDHPVFTDLGVLTATGQSLRTLVDRLTPMRRELSRLDVGSALMMAAASRGASSAKAAEAKAVSLRAQIKALRENHDAAPEQA